MSRQEGATQDAAGEKQRQHPHYLNGSIFCGQCSSRLISRLPTWSAGLTGSSEVANYSGRSGAIQLPVRVDQSTVGNSGSNSFTHSEMCSHSLRTRSEKRMSASPVTKVRKQTCTGAGANSMRADCGAGIRRSGAAVAHLVLLASLVITSGFFSLQGGVIIAIPAMLFAWILATSIVLLRTTIKADNELVAG